MSEEQEIDFSLVSPEVLMDYSNRTIVDVKNVRWSSASHDLIDGDVLFQELEALGYVSFTAKENDDTAHGVEFWTRANAGDYGEVAEYVPPVILPENVSLTAEQFYTALDSLGKLEDFMSTIETVTPLSMKLTCRNQFNNSTTFTWGMVLMSLVAPKIWGATWQDDIGDAWVSAKAL